MCSRSEKRIAIAVLIVAAIAIASLFAPVLRQSVGRGPASGFRASTSPTNVVVTSVAPRPVRVRRLRSTTRISPELESRLVQAAAHEEVLVSVIPESSQAREMVLAAVRRAGGRECDGFAPSPRFVRAWLPASSVRVLASEPGVHWLEPCARPRLLNDVAVSAPLLNAVPVRDDRGLTGAGQNVVVSDSGLDTGYPDDPDFAPDFSGRVYKVEPSFPGYPYRTLPEDYDGHGTHVAGSILGDGAMSMGRFKGVAPGARLWMWGCCDRWGNLYTPETDLLFAPDPTNFPACVHSASWGTTNNFYSAQCAEVDEWLWRHPDYLAVFAAGNEGAKAQTVGEPAGAKNVLAVGATENLRPDYQYASYSDNAAQIASFSSRGPMPDGRIKPDLCAPGTAVVSVRSLCMQDDPIWGYYAANSNYIYMSGTSQATPLVSGCALLARQWLIERRGHTNAPPTAALLRAMLVGGAEDLSGRPGTNCGGAAPNNVQGWGRLNLGETLYPTNASVILRDRIPFSQGSSYHLRVQTTNAAPLAVQLAWVDYPGDPAEEVALVNDLDLVVSNETTGVVYLGNDIAGVGARDELNVQESVRLPAAAAGTYSIFVRGAIVPHASEEGGAAALWLRGGFASEDAPQEMVSLRVSVEGDETGAVSPAVGEVSLEKGARVRFTAEPFYTTNETGSVVTRRLVAGWQGEGDVPGVGTDSEFTVRIERDSAIVWRWNEPENRLRRQLLIPSYGPYYWYSQDDWVATNLMLSVEVPADVPGGAETLDLTSYRYYYIDYNGKYRRMTTQRFAVAEVAAADADFGEEQRDAVGRALTNFAVSTCSPRDLLFLYYDIASTNLVSLLPTWWHERYLGAVDHCAGTDDPDGDGVSNAAEYAADTDPLDASSRLVITALTPERLAWKGGRERRQVVETTSSLSGPWRQVLNCAPPTPVENALQLTPTNAAFYRIRVSEK